MAKEYLDKAGLAYLWSKIKAYVNNHSAGVTLNDVYPVGAVYMSINSINPGTLFGGTWAEIEQPFVYPSGLIYPDAELYPSTGRIVYAWKRIV